MNDTDKLVKDIVAQARRTRASRKAGQARKDGWPQKYPETAIPPKRKTR
mgnify:CR=1 FL=1